MMERAQEDDDAQNWIPLRGEMAAANECQQTTASQSEQETQHESATNDNRGIISTGTSQPFDLAKVQRKLETSTKLQRELVDHPIQYFWIRFLRHFSHQAWLLSSVSTKLGVYLLILGGSLRILSIMMHGWYALVRFVILLGVLVGSLLVLAPSAPNGHQRAFLDMLFHPRVLLETVSDARHLRFIMLTVLMVPTLLEVRTLGFLTEMITPAEVDGGPWVTTGWVSALLWVAFGFMRGRRTLDAVRLATQQEQLNRTYTILVVTLYAAALVVSLWHFRLSTVPHLAGPVAWATGSLMLTLQQQDWIAILSRHALRLALRDTLERLSQNVQQDEMLQLAMIRWIVDYWSSSLRPATEGSTTQTTPVHAPLTTTTPSDVSSQQNPPEIQANLDWGEMRTMLEMTTEQMEQETVAPQEGRPAAPPDSNTAQTPKATPPEQNHEMNDSLWNLKNMLTQMNVDEHARPAVLAYKRAIQEQLPPARNVAMVFSVCRLSPAFLWVIWRFAVGATFASPSTAFLMLLPLMTIEVERVLLWAHFCTIAAPNETTRAGAAAETQAQAAPYHELLSIVKKGVDPMTMVLLTLDHGRSTILLQVWHNIQASVDALEHGLTAAQCLQTTAVAADFAGNLLSLVDFGVQVSQRGLGHGVGILLQEAMVWNSQVQGHQDSREVHELPPKYTGAAMNAIRNGHLVARNVGQLAQDDGLAPVLNALTVFVGRGWLWGHDHDDDFDNKDENQASSDQGRSEIPRNERAEDETVERESNRRRLTGIMEQMAACLEKGLITNQEKDNFMELLTRSDIEEQAIRSIEHTIKGLLDQQPATFTDGEDIRESFSRGISKDLTVPGECGNAAETSLAQKDTKMNAESSVSSVGNTNAHTVSQKDLLQEFRTPASQASSFDVAEPEPVPSFDRAISRPTTEEGSTAAPACSTTQDEGGDDIMKMFGATLAVAGAVVGGMALLQRAQNDQEEEEQARAQPPEVMIEELNDDDDDEWVEVSPST